MQRLAADRDDPQQVREQLLTWEAKGWRKGRSGRIASVPEAVGRAAVETFQRRPGQHTMLLIVGHGAGVLEGDETLGMEAGALGQALQGATERLGGPLDVLGLDTCFGGSLEKLWELRQVARYVTAAPGVVYAPGLAWDAVLLGSSWRDPQALVAKVAETGMIGGTQGAALVSVDSAKLGGVREALGALAEQLVLQVQRDGHAVTYARSRARSWGKRQELCDLGALAARLQESVTDPELVSRAAQVRQALAECVVGSWWGEGRPDDGSAGLGVYFPGTYEAVPVSYQRLQLATESGWYRFLDVYWAWVSSLIGGGTHPRL